VSVPSIAGYRLYSGQFSRVYTRETDLGMTTTSSVGGLATGVTYYFAVTAYDTNGLESGFSSEISYTVPPANNAPLVELTFPVNGATYTAPAEIDLAASVIANGQTITKVQFYNGTDLIGESSLPPYSFAWTGVGAGTFNLTALATDLLADRITSQPIAVVVTPPPDSSGVNGYVIKEIPGTARNGYSGFLGMQVIVGAAPISVTALGRMKADGNGGTHTVKLVNAADGTDVPGGAVSIAMDGVSVGQFRYANLDSPVVLAAGVAYYLVSHETAGGDFWYYDDTIVTTASVASEISAVWGDGGQWHVSGGAGQSYGPLDFKYATPPTSTPPTPPPTNPPPAISPTQYVTSSAPGLPRNGFSGFAGMQIVVGPAPVTVTELGRMMADGNTGTHTVKFVNAADGTDVPGGTVSIDMSTGMVGQFQYAHLGAPVVLSAGSTYYLVSQEAAGGDFWFYDDTTITTTSVASEISAAWVGSGGQWNLNGAAGQSFGPLDFKYTQN